MAENRPRPVRLGAVGAGRFARFSLGFYRDMPEVDLIAVADVDEGAAEAAAAELGAEAVVGAADRLLAREDVDLVYIAVPPWLHHDLAMTALAAGKHVLVEKPLATNMADAEEMVAEAQRRGLLLAVNLIQRYNPLFRVVRDVVDRGFLGRPLHGFFENYATDEPLPAGHWFWDRSKSGGIFVEHSVHFFDLVAGWLGPGKVVAAQATTRPETGVEDQAQCTLRYAEDVLFNFSHGFHQPKRMDRQELRIVFERGEVTLYDWVPTRLRALMLGTDGDLDGFRAACPEADVTEMERYRGDERHCSGHHRDYRVDLRAVLEARAASDKLALYEVVLKALLADQIEWLRNPEHARVIDERNGLESLRVGLEADRIAHRDP